MIGRVKRIYPSFLIMVACYIIAMSIAGQAPGFKAVALNTVMLSWFAKIDGAGHLWFVTGLMLFYMVLVLFTRFRFSRAGIWGLFSLTLALQGIGWALCIRQAYLLALILGGLLAYHFGCRALEVAQSLVNRLLVLLMLVGGLVVLSSGAWMLDLAVSPIAYYWLCLGLAVVVSLIVIMLPGLPRMVAPIAWLVDLSYEIYLVHYPFCASPVLGLRHYISNRFLYAFVFLVVTVLVARLLQVSSRWLMESLSHTRNPV